MESYSKLIDHDLTVYSMPWLPGQLKLPAGWTFINTTLSQTLNVTTTKGTPGYSIVLFDDVSNMYTYAGSDYSTVLAQYGVNGASNAASTVPGECCAARIAADQRCVTNYSADLTRPRSWNPGEPGASPEEFLEFLESQCLPGAKDEVMSHIFPCAFNAG